MIERLLAAERALAAGQLELADRLFGQVAETDDRNAIAVAGLAEVALARGDASAAQDLARRALAIDPEEAAAARVLATAPTKRAGAVPKGGRPGPTGPSMGQAKQAAAAPTGSRFATWLRWLLRRD